MNELLPATTLLDETETVPSELRAVYQTEWNPKTRKYLRERRLRELAHELKAAQVQRTLPTDAQIDVLPDEDI